LPGRLGRPPQHGLDVAGLAGVVDQPGQVDLPVGGGGQRLQDPPVQLPASQGRQRALHRPPEQLVAEPDRLGASHQQPAGHGGLDRRRRRPQRRLQQPQLGPGRDHCDQPHHLLGVRRQTPEAGQHQVAHGHRDAGVAGGQDLGHQQGVPAGQRAQARHWAAGPPGQLGHRRLRQRLQPQVAHRLRRQPAHGRAERMVGRHLVVSVGEQQQRPGPLHPSPQEHQQVQGGLVGPVSVLDHDHPRPAPLVQLVQERGEDGLPWPPRGQQLG
jgi:hypothetical protein